MTTEESDVTLGTKWHHVDLWRPFMDIKSTWPSPKGLQVLKLALKGHFREELPNPREPLSGQTTQQSRTNEALWSLNCVHGTECDSRKNRTTGSIFLRSLVFPTVKGTRQCQSKGRGSHMWRSEIILQLTLQRSGIVQHSSFLQSWYLSSTAYQAILCDRQIVLVLLTSPWS